ncbi:MAG: ferrochelatase [Phenylobacterium sp.]
MLINLGTPSQPDTASVRRYLKQFLSDPRVIDYPRWLWKLILNLVILPVRSRKVAKLYESIWYQEGSPLRVITLRQAQALQTRLASHGANGGDEIPVEVAMTYGSPSMQYGVDQLLSQGVTRFVVLPLYPQYSATTTGAAFDALNDVLRQVRNLPEIRFIKNYAHKDSYINALANTIKRHRENAILADKPDILLFSFHGLPERYISLGDPYQSECEATARRTVEALGLKDSEWRISYQSRVGREKWIGPYTAQLLTELPGEGIKKIDVVCPAFAVDCLETLEETAVENKAIFMAAGGESYDYIAALNDGDEHIEVLAEQVVEQLKW